MAFEPVNDLERSLIRAATDPAHRPQFYKDFIGADILAVQHGPLKKEPEKRVIARDESIQLRTWQRNGQTLLPIFTSLLRLQTFIKEEASYLAMNALAFLQMTKGATLHLNPGSDYGKEFTALEVASILDGSLWKPIESYTTQKEEKVLIGQPANYPHELVAALSRYFQTVPQVNRAYLAHFFNAERDQKPHTLIAIDVTGDWDQIAAGAGLVSRDVKIPDPPIDFLQIAGKGGVEDHFKTGVKPFYEKTA